MPIFLLAALGVPALYVGLIRGLALACAPTRETDSQAATWLRWLHWLVTGSALLCLVLVTGELELHYPLFVLAWLLGSGVLAGGRLRLRQLLPEESSWGKFQAWGLGLLSPLLLGAALASRADVAFEDANARVEVDRSFPWEANEDFGRLRFYQTRCFLFTNKWGGGISAKSGCPRQALCTAATGGRSPWQLFSTQQPTRRRYFSLVLRSEPLLFG